MLFISYKQHSVEFYFFKSQSKNLVIDEFNPATFITVMFEFIPTILFCLSLFLPFYFVIFIYHVSSYLLASFSSIC